jgi:hypothetical protein
MPDYGNVPNEDVRALAEAARIAQEACAALPPNAPDTWRNIAYQGLLTGILDDWVINGTNDLDEGDEEDLANLLRVAADIALDQDPQLRDIAFPALLKAAMGDWVANWNAAEP